MCTAFGFTARERYFGRNLDLDRSYGEEVCILPRRAPVDFCHMGSMPRHYAMIGMATVPGGLPLFYDAVNEHGLAMAGLSFPGNAWYAPATEGKDNIASFELIPWILGQCKSAEEAERLLSRMNLTDTAFDAKLTPSPLHFIICDKKRALTVEPMRDGLHLLDNPVGVLTNNPPFVHQLANLERYRQLRPDNTEVVREVLPYATYSQGLGAVGLPGDVSSMSRFARIVFGLSYATRPEAEAAAVGQVFHLLSSVEMVEGLCITDEGTRDITVYSACINIDRGRYYYTTYGNRRISCVDMQRADLNGTTVTRFPLVPGESIFAQN